MYESPIEIFSNQMRIEQEENIYKAVLKQAIIVEKDELIKALRYDRDQYDKGYRDGRNSVLQKLREMMEEL